MSWALSARARLRGAPNWLVGVVVISSMTLDAGALRAAPEVTKAQCLSAYEDGQRARRSGAFQQATAAFALCGGPSCPQALHADCQRWLDDVEVATPTSVFRVSSTRGDELHGVSISVDGGAAQKLEGRALAFDPGEHSIRFESPDHRPLERQFTFTEGEKLVVREVELEALQEPADDPPAARAEPVDGTAHEGSSSSSGLPVWIGAGVGAAGLVGFSYFALTARADDRALAECTPNCSTAQVEQVERGYQRAHVSLAIGAAGVVGAAVWLLFGSDDEPASRATVSVNDLELYLGPTTWLTGRF